jgi:hypothetical protein
VKVRTAQNWLAGEWIILGLLVFAILVAQYLWNKYGSLWQEPFDWYAAMILPTLSLLVAYFFPHAASHAPGAGAAPAPLQPPNAAAGAADDHVALVRFVVAFTLNSFYLLCCLGVVIAAAFRDGDNLHDFLKNSQAVLHAIQAFCGVSLGLFFVSAQRA